MGGDGVTPTETTMERARRDIHRAHDHWKIVIETERGVLRQGELDKLTILSLPDGIGLELKVSLSSAKSRRVAYDLCDVRAAIYVYGDQHLWRLTNAVKGESNTRHDGGEYVTVTYDAVWASVEEVDWR